ncbi:hypothetical protein P5673_031789 [Acropora cervicornis]|uniref:Uncharacterized protein n=1 Tax=Acropora cervicornis TaxID=6130 RepID=A0AAD9US90_ACRCE|nr:hypothetical protein P5673_031789 [Acropora cervicornis]
MHLAWDIVPVHAIPFGLYPFLPTYYLYIFTYIAYETNKVDRNHKSFDGISVILLVRDIGQLPSISVQRTSEQKVQTLHRNSLETFKQGQGMEFQLLNTRISFCQEHLRMSTTSRSLKALLQKIDLEMKRLYNRYNFGNEKVATDITS